MGCSLPTDLQDAGCKAWCNVAFVPTAQCKQKGQLGTWTVLLLLGLLSCEQSPFGKKKQHSSVGDGNRVDTHCHQVCDCPWVISAPMLEIKNGLHYSAVLFLSFRGLLHGKSILGEKKCPLTCQLIRCVCLKWPSPIGPQRKDCFILPLQCLTHRLPRHYTFTALNQ